MPHFILECSKNLLADDDKPALMQFVFDLANESQLFDRENIKVRIRPYEFHLSAYDDKRFLHVFAYIMEGRTTAQKKDLSEALVRGLVSRFPDVPVVSLNVMEFDKATYNNRNSI